MLIKKQIKNVPELRFPEFGDEWVEVSFKNIVKIIDCKHRTPPYVESGIPVVSPGTIKWGEIDLESPTKRVTENEYLSLMNHCTPECGDMVFSRNQSFGIASILFKKERFVLGQDTVLIKAETINSFYLYQKIQTSTVQRQIAKLSGGSTFSRINLQDIRRLRFRISVTLPEQQKVASFLTAIDKKIEQLTRKKELLEQYKKGVMQKLFSQEIRFKDNNGQDYPDWEKKAIGQFLREFKERVPATTELPVLTSSRNGLYAQSEYFDSRELKNEGEYGVVPKGYFTYRHMSDDSIFKFNINTICERGAISKEYPVFTTEGMDSYFLYVILNFGADFQRFAHMQKKGGTRTRLYFSVLKELVVNLPSHIEQRKISNLLSSIDEKINILQNQITITQNFKKGLLQKMFV